MSAARKRGRYKTGSLDHKCEYLSKKVNRIEGHRKMKGHVYEDASTSLSMRVRMKNRRNQLEDLKLRGRISDILDKLSNMF